MTESDVNNFTLLRLSLALMVVLGHAKLLSGTAWPQFPFNLADAAVDAFFVVSGYLITGSYQRCHGLWSFYVRRIFRLYPMYLCIVLAQTVAMLLLLPGGPFSAGAETLRYVAANAMLANFVQYDIGGVLDGLRNPGINPSLWTLKIEIGFYLIVPAIYAATRRWGPRVLAAIFVASVAYAVLLRHHGRRSPCPTASRPVAILRRRHGALFVWPAVAGERLAHRTDCCRVFHCLELRASDPRGSAAADRRGIRAQRRIEHAAAPSAHRSVRTASTSSTVHCCKF